MIKIYCKNPNDKIDKNCTTTMEFSNDGNNCTTFSLIYLVLLKANPIIHNNANIGTNTTRNTLKNVFGFNP